MVKGSAFFLTALLLTLGVSTSYADSAVKPLTTECIKEVADRYELHPDILFALMLVEGGTVGKDSRQNTNGSYDIGLFQINTTHLRTLKELGISESALRNDGCLNAAVAGWHLRRILTDEVMAGIHDEESYLRAIALYHSATPRFNQIYANKLRNAFAYLYQQRETE